jgi:hypothetical protein
MSSSLALNRVETRNTHHPMQATRFRLVPRSYRDSNASHTPEKLETSAPLLSLPGELLASVLRSIPGIVTYFTRFGRVETETGRIGSETGRGDGGSVEEEIGGGEERENDPELISRHEMGSSASTRVASRLNSGLLASSEEIYSLPPVPSDLRVALEDRKRKLREAMDLEIEDMKRKMMEGAEKAASGVEGWFGSVEVEEVRCSLVLCAFLVFG